MTQVGELQDRKTKLIADDPVIDFRHVTIKDDQAEKQFTATIRNSGQIDLYWNCKLVFSSDKDKCIIKQERNGLKTETVTEKIRFNGICLNF